MALHPSTRHANARQCGEMMIASDKCEILLFKLLKMVQPKDTLVCRSVLEIFAWNLLNFSFSVVRKKNNRKKLNLLSLFIALCFRFSSRYISICLWLPCCAYVIMWIDEQFPSITQCNPSILKTSSTFTTILQCFLLPYKRWYTIVNLLLSRFSSEVT